MMWFEDKKEIQFLHQTHVQTKGYFTQACFKKISFTLYNTYPLVKLKLVVYFIL